MHILNGLFLDCLQEILIKQDVPLPQGDRLYTEIFHQNENCFICCQTYVKQEEKSGLSDS